MNVPENNVYTGNGELLRDANPFRYSGYQYDLETELYYLKARYYSLYLGRFITEDPVISMNRYRYCKNNPVNFVDPLGLANVAPEMGGSYEKFVYVPFKSPVKSKDNKVYSGYFVSTSNNKDYQDIGTQLGKVQFEGELVTPIQRESVIVSATIEKVRIQTYSLNGSKQIKTSYHGPASFTIINRAYNYSSMIEGVGLLGGIGGILGKLIKVNEAVSAFSIFIGVGALNSANEEFKPDWMVESDIYMLNK